MIVTLPQLFIQQTGMALMRTHFYHILIESTAAASAKGNLRRFAMFCGLAGSLQARVRGLTGILRKNVVRPLMRRSHVPFYNDRPQTDISVLALTGYHIVMSDALPI